MIKTSSRDDEWRRKGAGAICVCGGELADICSDGLQIHDGAGAASHFKLLLHKGAFFCKGITTCEEDAAVTCYKT